MTHLCSAPNPLIPATLVFLGTGASLGTPVVGCHCPICHSDVPHNKRLRTAALLRLPFKRFLIDCGPDFRQQALREDLGKIDGLFLTHAHYDHIAALDELRIYAMRQQKSMPTLLSATTAEEVYRRFSYIFVAKEIDGKKIPPQLELQRLPALEGTIDFCGLTTRYVTYEQSGMPVNGYRWGDLAYLTDIRHFPESIFTMLQDIKILIIGALKFTPSPFHFTIDEAIEFSKKTSAKRVWLTHISHEVEHEKTNAYLPDNIRLAYDGLEIPFLLG